MTAHSPGLSEINSLLKSIKKKNGKEEKMYNNSFMSINNHQFTSKKTYDREI
jgi:hypothetical protein